MIDFSHINVRSTSMKSYHHLFLNRNYNWVWGVGFILTRLAQHSIAHRCTCSGRKVNEKDEGFYLESTFNSSSLKKRRKEKKDRTQSVSLLRNHHGSTMQTYGQQTRWHQSQKCPVTGPCSTPQSGVVPMQNTPDVST